MNKIIFIADFFSYQVNGGAELNDHEFINFLIKKNYEVESINSSICDIKYIESNRSNFFVISNFVLLHASCLEYLEKNCNYVIYEHDHKYLKNRNPAIFTNFEAPKDEITNYNFYKNAKSVLCQSSFHKDIIFRNLKLENLINLSGNFWSDDVLNLLLHLTNNKKTDFAAIMNSNNRNKNTIESIKYCQVKKIKYSLINECKHEEFLEKLSVNSKLVFFPKSPETLSRISVEARMLNLSVITNNNLGASYEEWFKLKGQNLIEVMQNKKYEIINIFENILNENNTSR